MRLVAGGVKAKATELDYPVPYMVIEPGRSVVASAGITLYTAGHIKEIPGIRTYVSIDGGMTDNPRYALYQAAYTVVNASKADQPADTSVTLAGRCCESGDLIQENAPIRTCTPGDVLAVLATGAYNYSMSSNYNRLPRPAVVMVREGTSRVVVKAETYEELIRNEGAASAVVPSHTIGIAAVFYQEALEISSRNPITGRRPVRAADPFVMVTRM